MNTRFNAVLLELPYLPAPAWWALWPLAGAVWLEGGEHFRKQTCRNRCTILTANGPDTLVVPVRGGRSGTKTGIRQVPIDYGQPWLRRHWGALEAAYGRSAFFEHYEGGLRAVYEQKPDFLFDLNLALLSKCRVWLGLSTQPEVVSSYREAYPAPVLDARGLISCKKPPVGYEPVAYRQNFGERFFPHLSILDALFCLGPQAGTVLHTGWPDASAAKAFSRPEFSD